MNFSILVIICSSLGLVYAENLSHQANPPETSVITKSRALATPSKRQNERILRIDIQDWFPGNLSLADRKSIFEENLRLYRRELVEFEAVKNDNRALLTHLPIDSRSRNDRERL